MREEEEKEGGDKGGGGGEKGEGGGEVGVHKEGEGEDHKAGVAVDVVALPTLQEPLHLVMVS